VDNPVRADIQVQADILDLEDTQGPRDHQESQVVQLSLYVSHCNCKGL
jgi:hypothetical protein